MKKSILILALCFILMFAVAAVSAQEAEESPVVSEEETVVSEEETVEAPAEAEETDTADGSYTVTYLENNCLAEVPTDEATYAAGDEVTVLFEPVQYKDYLIFYGWDWDNDGFADFGYNYNTFEMPEKDVELKAICISAYSGSGCPGCHLHGIPTWGEFSGFSFGGRSSLVP